MKIIFFDEHGEIGNSAEQPWQRYKEAVDDARKVLQGRNPTILEPLTEEEKEEIEEELSRPGKIDMQDAKVIALVTRYRTGGHLNDKDQEDIMTGCIAFWCTSIKIITEFDRMAPTHDGLVLITPEGLEAGWYNLGS